MSLKLMASTIRPESESLAALIAPCTLITFPINSVVPGANAVTHPRVLSEWPRLVNALLVQAAQVLGPLLAGQQVRERGPLAASAC